MDSPAAPADAGLSGGAIAGIVIGVLALILIAAYIAGYFFLYRKMILLKGRAFEIIYAPMDAMFKR